MKLFKNKKITITLIAIVLISGISIPLYNNYKSKDEAEVEVSTSGEQTELEDNIEDVSDSEYGNINKDKFKISKSSEKAEDVDMENGLVYGKDEAGNATVKDIKNYIPDNINNGIDTTEDLEKQFKEMQDELKQEAQSKPTTPTPPPVQQKPAEKPQQQQKQSGGVWTPPPGFVSPYASVTPEEQAEIDEALTNPGGSSGTIVTGNSDKLGTWG